MEVRDEGDASRIDIFINSLLIRSSPRAFVFGEQA